jgi:uncharacterized protein (DUF1501 family)
MKRRNFIQLGSLASTSVLIPGFLKSLEQQTLQGIAGNKRLVIVQLSGGNDGLNTLVPFRNDIYFKQRPKLAIPSDKVLRINDETGFHPSLDGFRKLFDQGWMSIYNSVGYPNPDRSHFRSMDIWHTASNADEYMNTGWIGRWLDARCTGCEQAWYALEVDDTLSLAMKGALQSGFAMRDPARLHQLVSDEFYHELIETRNSFEDSGELQFLYKTLRETCSSAEHIYQISKKAKDGSGYPDHPFAENLRKISTLIRSGLETRVYYTELGGFDTHVQQAGIQERLLGLLGQSLYTFTKELNDSGQLNDTLIMVFSEFGRRVKQNASNGTDHGTANQVYIIGGKLKRAGILNPLPDLENLENGDMVHQLDFRRIYATLLEQISGMDHQQALRRKFELLDFI